MKRIRTEKMCDCKKIRRVPGTKEDSDGDGKDDIQAPATSPPFTSGGECEEGKCWRP